jgi:hypothetical protein
MRARSTGEETGEGPGSRTAAIAGAVGCVNGAVARLED